MSLTRVLQLTIAIASFSVNLAAQELSLDQIVKKNEDALGGAEAIDRVVTLRLTVMTTVETPAGRMSVPMTIWSKRPDFYRMEMEIAGTHLIVGNDAQNAWKIDPSTGSSVPRKAAENEASGPSLFPSGRISVLIGALSEYKRDGNVLELVGKDTRAGLPPYKIRVTPKTGGAMTCFLDAVTFLPIERTSTSLFASANLEEIRFGEYKSVGGIVFAHTIDRGAVMHAEIQKIEVNIPMEDALFAMPGVDAQLKK